VRTVLVTRPQGEAERWVQQLQAQGLAAQALPLMAIEPVIDAAARQALWQGLPQWSALMFVSGNAVAQFFGPGAGAWPAGVRALAPGPGTARALVRCGVPPECIDAPPEDAPQFDSEALWAVMGERDWRGRSVCVVRGQGAREARSSGRDWLAQQLQAAGARVDDVAVYRRTVPDWTPAQHQRMQAAQTDGSLWLFSSSEAVVNLPAGLRWHAAQALATHPRIAQAARQAGFGRVQETRPALADVVASIKSGPP